MPSASQGLRLAIDIGGTFTDTVLMRGQSEVIATDKTATTPSQPATGALMGAERALSQAGASWGEVTTFIHGTTLATNALIERRGANVATITTEGFRDILEIAYERRYAQYAIDIEKPDLIVPRSRAFTIGGRIDVHGTVRTPLDEAGVAELADEFRSEGVEAVAICLLHAYANPAHELRLRTLLQTALPDLVISLSHEVSPEAREFDRLCTTIANAYIQPLMSGYLHNLESRFAAKGLGCQILMMTAGGGMTTVETAARLPIRLVESGPAGGAVLAARVAAQIDARDVLSFDMGGTTAKLCLIDNFQPQTARKFEISRAERFIKGSGMPVRIPVVEMIEIGAGGGSIARVDRLGRLQVGPHSAGADPGPAAFGLGGNDPTVTDADIAQGLIDPERFAEGRLRIDPVAAEQALVQSVGMPLGVDGPSAGQGVSEIVDESMASAGRMHAVESGKDLGARTMVAFGGNGPLHATRVARRAQVRRIVVPADPGVGSAVGFLYAPVSYEIVRSRYMTLESLDLSRLKSLFDEMLRDAEAVVRAGAPTGPLIRRRSAFMRYRGQGHEIEIDLPDRDLRDDDLGSLHAVFEAEYARQFVRVVPDMTIEVLNWSVSVLSQTKTAPAPADAVSHKEAQATGTRRILCDVSGIWRDAAVHDRSTLSPGSRITGPALIVEPQTTTFVSADFAAEIDASANIILTAAGENPQ